MVNYYELDYLVRITLFVFKCDRASLGILPESYGVMYGNISFKNRSSNSWGFLVNLRLETFTFYRYGVLKNGRQEKVRVPNHTSCISDLETTSASWVAVVEDEVTIDLLKSNMTAFLSRGIIIATKGNLYHFYVYFYFYIFCQGIPSFGVRHFLRHLSVDLQLPMTAVMDGDAVGATNYKNIRYIAFSRDPCHLPVNSSREVVSPETNFLAYFTSIANICHGQQTMQNLDF